jgi:transcriptional regulator with XRE-family HTH domain
VRELRIARGLSQAELAGDTLSASMISLVESGRREPTERTLELLAQRLQSTTAYLRHGTTPASADRVRLALCEAELLLYSGHWAEARDRFTALVRQWDTAPEHHGRDEHLVRRTRLGRAMAYEQTGRVADAIVELEDLRGVGGHVSKDWLLDADVVLSRCYRRVGRHTDCLQLTTTTMALAESLGLQGMANHSELAINLIYELHEHRRVSDAVIEARRLLDVIMIPAAPEPASAYREASAHAAAAGHIAEALAMAERALAAYTTITDARSTAMMRVVAATVVLHHDSTAADLATKALRQVYDVLLPLDACTELAFCESALARAAVQRDDAADAVYWADLAIRHSADLEPRPELAWALMVRCRCHHAAGRPDLARLDATAAWQVLSVLSPSRHAAATWRELGSVLRDLGEIRSALDAYERALDSMDVRRVSQITEI